LPGRPRSGRPRPLRLAWGRRSKGNAMMRPIASARANTHAAVRAVLTVGEQEQGLGGAGCWMKGRMLCTLRAVQPRRAAVARGAAGGSCVCSWRNYQNLGGAGPRHLDPRDTIAMVVVSNGVYLVVLTTLVRRRRRCEGTRGGRGTLSWVRTCICTRSTQPLAEQAVRPACCKGRFVGVHPCSGVDCGKIQSEQPQRLDTATDSWRAV
jgi:hypothetical protein